MPLRTESSNGVQEPEKLQQKRKLAQESSTSEDEGTLNPVPPTWGAQKPNRNTLVPPTTMLPRSVAESWGGPHAAVASPSAATAPSGMGRRLSKFLDRQVCDFHL